MKKIEIYENFGVLGDEKRSVYTYGGEHYRATCSDRIRVSLPENKYFKIYETATGELAVESSWGWNYSIDEVLQGKEKPCFFAVDKEQNGHRVYLGIPVGIPLGNPDKNRIEKRRKEYILYLVHFASGCTTFLIGVDTCKILD